MSSSMMRAKLSVKSSAKRSIASRQFVHIAALARSGGTPAAPNLLQSVHSGLLLQKWEAHFARGDT
jgi:hypothetical protein